MKEKIRAPWAPFPHEYSSCSNLKPESFEWSKTEGRYSVYIDNTIMNHNGVKDNSFGWFCESSEILPNLKKYLISNKNLLKTRFDKIFTCDNQLINIDPSFYIYNPPGSNLPWTKKNDYKLYDKNKLCSMIASSKDMTTGHKLRITNAHKYQNQGVDVFGGAIGSKRIGEGTGPNKDWWRSKELALADYCFSIVFENAAYPNYHTEKITDCFAQGVVPIYWGDPLIGNKFNEKGIIKWETNFDIKSLSLELYLSMKNYIEDNMERVKKMENADDCLYREIKKIKR